MSRKKKVLIVTQRFEYGGLDFVAIRLQQALDKEKFECTYCVRNEKQDNRIEESLTSAGIKVIHQPKNESGYIKSYFYYRKLFKKEHFDIVHCHLPFYSGIVMAAAKKSGIKKRVSHSHYSQPLIWEHSKFKRFSAEVYRRIMRKIIGIYSTDIIGCSLEAGQYLCGKKTFSKKGVVLNNGINVKEYELTKDRRLSKRKELHIDDKIVLGHIGQMYYVKNQSFLIDVFYVFQKLNKDSVLLLIGDGPDRNMLEQKVKRLGIYEKVKFLGFRDDVPDLLMAMDCFVFPSFHEGFPLTLIEAQMTKLPCVVSDTVTKTAKLNSNVSYVSLDSGTDIWCNEIKKRLDESRESIDHSKVINEFDIKTIAKKLEDIYSF